MTNKHAAPRSTDDSSGEPSAANPYCLSCGRLMPHEKKSDPTPRKYCSASCRGHAKDLGLKPIRASLAQTFHNRLAHSPKRTIVLCSEAERQVFAPIDDDVASVTDARRKQLESPEQREEARRAARRLVAFGFASQGIMETRAVEAVQDGKIVETSFAKGEWGIRWAT